MGWIAAPYSPQTGKLVPNGAFGHLWHIISYAANQTSPHGPQGIASYPWDWLIDIKPITYLQINPARPTAALNQIEPAVHFLGMISPADPPARVAGTARQLRGRGPSTGARLVVVGT